MDQEIGCSCCTEGVAWSEPFRKVLRDSLNQIEKDARHDR
jgi:hypothetical protein